MRRIETEELRLVEAGAFLDFSGIMGGISSIIKSFGTSTQVKSFNSVDQGRIFFLDYNNDSNEFTFGLNYLKILGLRGAFGAILSFFGLGTVEKSFSLSELFN